MSLDIAHNKAYRLENSKVPGHRGLGQWQFMDQVAGDAAVLGQEMLHNGQSSRMAQGLEYLRPLEQLRRVMIGFC